MQSINPTRNPLSATEILNIIFNITCGVFYAHQNRISVLALSSSTIYISNENYNMLISGFRYPIFSLLKKEFNENNEEISYFAYPLPKLDKASKTKDVGSILNIWCKLFKPEMGNPTVKTIFKAQPAHPWSKVLKHYSAKASASSRQLRGILYYITLYMFS